MYDQLITLSLMFSKLYVKCISFLILLIPLRSCLVHLAKAWPGFKRLVRVCVMRDAPGARLRAEKCYLFFRLYSTLPATKQNLSDPQKTYQEGMMGKHVAFINSHLLPTKQQQKKQANGEKG